VGEKGGAPSVLFPSTPVGTVLRKGRREGWKSFYLIRPERRKGGDDEKPSKKSLALQFGAGKKG